MGSGVTQAQVFQCSDGQQYIVKSQYNPQGVKVLVNELIANKIARFLDLPVPRGNVILIPPELALETSYLPAGKHFGTVLAEHALDCPPLHLIETAANASCVPGIYVFDYYIDNSDRHNGNIMICPTDSGNKILLIDHGNCFGSYFWSIADLHMLASTGAVVSCQVHLELIHLVAGEAPFDLWLDRVESIGAGQLEAIIDEIPLEWNISEEERKALLYCLLSRRHKVRPVLTSMKSQFPNWK